MAHSIVGKISSNTGCFKWTIDEYLLRRNITLQSPIFSFSDARFSIYLTYSIVNGHRLVTELCCRKMCNSPSQELDVKFRIRECRCKVQTLRGKMESGEFAVYNLLIWSDDWQKKRNLQMDKLTIFCKLSLDEEENASVLPGKRPRTDEGENSASDSDEEELISKRKTTKKMKEDFKNLFSSGEDSDVTLIVQGKIFLAHRLILQSRSPVFKCMFSRNTAEKQSGIVVIDDCDPVAFPVFLKYLYTGSTKRISNKNVFSLYTTSDKYGVEELKEQCAAFMGSNMSVGTFCSTITLALLHTDKELLGVAKGFFCENGLEIIKTEEWQTFLSENLKVGNELFESLLLKIKN